VAIDLAYATGSGVTITNSETSIGVTGGTTSGVPVARTDAGIYMVFIDGVANMVKGDEYKWKVYEKARSGGTVRAILVGTISDAQSEMVVIPNLILGVGWDVTLQRISATSRAFDWSIRRVS
jgi:hypothetical protein